MSMVALFGARNKLRIAVLSKPIPRWILFSAFALAWAAGTINAVGFLGLHHGLSHMSGPVTALGNELARSAMFPAWDVLIVIASFFAGCTLSSLIIGQGFLQLGRGYGFVLLVESAALFAAWWLLLRDKISGECLAAFACGLQNAMVSSYSGAVIRTTHVTGIITDLGISLGQLLRGQAVDRRRAGLYSILLAGFFVGGVCGSLGFYRVGYNALLMPAALTAAGGFSYFLRSRKRAHGHPQ
jgi:uncharacterized membrane protein YoaK (UPF0700 family)